MFYNYNYPEKLGGGVNNIPSKGSDGRGRRVVSDNEQGGVGNVNAPVEDERTPLADERVASEPLGGKNDRRGVCLYDKCFCECVSLEGLYMCASIQTRRMTKMPFMKW